MDKRCPYCGISVVGQLWCPLCETRLVRVNLRRGLLWALVIEEYAFVAVIILRFS